MITGLGSRSDAANAQLSAVTSRKRSLKACGIASSRPISPRGTCSPVLAKEYRWAGQLCPSPPYLEPPKGAVILRTSSFGRRHAGLGLGVRWLKIS
jgi:hypothetical protein